MLLRVVLVWVALVATLDYDHWRLALAALVLLRVALVHRLLPVVLVQTLVHLVLLLRVHRRRLAVVLVQSLLEGLCPVAWLRLHRLVASRYLVSRRDVLEESEQFRLSDETVLFEVKGFDILLYFLGRESARVIEGDV